MSNNSGMFCSGMTGLLCSGMVAYFSPEYSFTRVIEYRNLLAHGTFFYGDPHGNIDKFQVRNTKLNKKGFYDNTNIISIKSLQKLNTDLLKLKIFIESLTFYINQNSKRPDDNLYKVMKSIISNLQIELEIDGNSVQI